jgi:hypothetical protein
MHGVVRKQGQNEFGDTIVVNFALGSSAFRTLEKDAIVRHINGNY